MIDGMERERAFKQVGAIDLVAANANPAWIGSVNGAGGDGRESPRGE